MPSLKSRFQKDFMIGTAINARQIKESIPAETELIAKQFSAITPENVMKAQSLQPRWNTFNFEMADQMITFANKYQMKVNAHTLVWHSQLPVFVRTLQTADSVRMFMTNHINTVARRYHGKVQSWDVVNEALNEDGTLRKSIFYNKLGEDYIIEAFRLAEAATPDTDLYYNDYNNEKPAKRKGCIDVIKKIQAAGVKIDGVGIQGHWHLGKVPLQDIEESIVQYAALGIKVAITELDIEVLKRDFQGAEISQRMKSDPSLDPYKAGLPDSLQQRLAEDYDALFKLFIKHKDKIARITLWGAHDGQTWLNGWPVPGRTNYPLLFDRDYKPKPAFYKIIESK
ncbi:MAG TPA: endo-1,4-beta-xylanase [Dyadobacter sp.]|nr:endo-1,4-beta-xylanase [Dyadobacter sp.]